ncbi:MAG: 50S ribosomal protein L25/general stress protein Ctc [Bacteroidetes bacterium]|jgi:large subunit ribosomal protein L25|nr:50S ribosomal protein L25/general stress protein Ctc [Bacteroidota bacterium]MDA0936862.1 50S ribosomal protein L25/general stress protein Ctc [Bacteroidota bacterium]
MKSITIKGSKRESVGKVATKALRNADKVPCVLYGSENPLHFSANELDFSKLVYTPNAHTVVLDIDGNQKINAILQDIQFHPVSDKILHVDFYQLSDDKEVSMDIPVQIEGSSPGVMLEGGVLVISKRKLKVKALPKNLPDFINVDISKLKLGNKISTVDLQSEAYSFLHPDNTVVCKVRTSRASMSISSGVDDAETPEEGAEATAEEAEGAANEG